VWIKGIETPATLVAAQDSSNDVSSWLDVLVLVVVTTGVLVTVVVLVVLARRSLQRRRVAHATATQQLTWRGEFIAALIERVGRDTHRSARLNWMCKRLGWSRGHADLIMGYLTAKDLIETTAWGTGAGEPWETLGLLVGGVRVRLTAAGLDEAERAERGPTEHLPRITAIDSIVVTGQNARVAGSIKSPRSTQTVHQEGMDPDEVAHWIGDYWEALTHAAVLSAADRARAEHLLMRLDEANREGDRERVARLGRALRAIAEGVAGNAAYAVLVAAGHGLFG
jgi:hypothetical protein